MASPLKQILTREIEACGPISFARFMAQALYHPEHGYYSSGRAQIGRAGDYFTSVSVGPLFGRMLAAQFAEIRERLGAPGEFTLVEQGAHGGEFARDVLTHLRGPVRYVIVEPFPELRERQRVTLQDFAERVTWCASLDELTPFRGLHFSNELIDALPVHLLKRVGGVWRERFVTVEAEQFAIVDRPIENAKLRTRAQEIPLPLPDGFETEVSLAAAEWIEAVSAKLEAGYIMAADYGMVRDEYYAPRRTSGTLQAYAAHRLVPSALIDPGAVDITAHVEWTSLAEEARALGLEVCGFTDQHHFLTGLLDEELASDAANTRKLQTLLHPGFLGMKFQFIVLARNVPESAKLRGLRFARDSALTLGLSGA